MRKYLLLLLCVPFWVSANADFSVKVLCYHNIVDKPKFVFDVSTVEFEKQMKHLADNGYISLKASELTRMIENKELLPGKKYVVITFDDGNDGFYKNGVPILEKYDLKMTFYIYPSIIFSREKGKHKSYMTWKQIRELAERKNFEIGCHSYYHPFLSKEHGEGLRLNVEKAKTTLKNMTGKDTVTFAYPFGNYSDEAIEWIKKTGFKGAFALETGRKIDFNTNLFVIPRFMMLRNVKLDEFSKIVSNQSVSKTTAEKKTKKKNKNKSKKEIS